MSTHPQQDSHSTESPEHTGAMLWIIFGLLGVVAAFVGIISLVPKQ